MAADENEVLQAIRKKMDRRGERLVILAHHYQRPEIVALGHFVGDSFALSQKAAACEKAHNIIFCGVHFMAESAAVLAAPHQVVQIPDMEAGCPMADMADPVSVSKAWDELSAVAGSSIIPLVYMNSSAELKAFCGAHGGAVCTSSNAKTAIKWGFSKAERVLFFPDQHLGRNSANALKIARHQIIVWTPGKPLGGNTEQSVRNSKIILWDGFCHVHTKFLPEHILNVRQNNPSAKIIVHPECTEDVVNLADASGSTDQIIRFVKAQTTGSTIVIGTEIHLIERLATANPDKTIVPLLQSLCPNMYKISPEKLLAVLENPGTLNRVEIEEGVKADAKKALQRMLELTP